jgi:hypothetical protein
MASGQTGEVYHPDPRHIGALQNCHVVEERYAEALLFQTMYRNLYLADISLYIDPAISSL